MANRSCILQTQYCIDLPQILHYVETLIKQSQNWNHVIFQIPFPPSLPDHIQIQDTFVPWAPTTCYLGLMLDSKLLFSRCLHTIANKATGVFCNIFPLLTQDSALTLSNKLSIYNYLFDPFWLTPPMSGAPHAPPCDDIECHLQFWCFVCVCVCVSYSKCHYSFPATIESENKSSLSVISTFWFFFIFQLWLWYKIETDFLFS